MISWIKDKFKSNKIRIYDNYSYTVVNASLVTGAGLTVAVSYQPISGIQHTHGYKDWRGRIIVNRKSYIVNLAIL